MANTVPPPSEPLLTGDPAAWVDRYGDALLRFAVGRVGAQEVAEDLVQETLLVAWVNREKFDGRSQFSTWLVGILRKKIADHYRRQARTPVHDSPTDISQVNDELDPFTGRGLWKQSPQRWHGDPAQAAESAEFRVAASGCLGDLPPHLRQAFELRELGEATPKEIGLLLGITPQNLAVRLHRARLLLRSCLEQKYFGIAASVKGSQGAAS